MKITNLTPHPLALAGDNGTLEVPPSGQIARLAVTRTALAPVTVEGITLLVAVTQTKKNMSENIKELIFDARNALENIEANKSLVFKKAAAEWLQAIAKEISADISNQKNDDV